MYRGAELRWKSELTADPSAMSGLSIDVCGKAR
jgi:hypothetical protein